MTVSAIEFSRLGPPKLVPYAMRCTSCKHLHPWWEQYTCEKCKGRELVVEKLKGFLGSRQSPNDIEIGSAQKFGIVAAWRRQDIQLLQPAIDVCIDKIAFGKFRPGFDRC